MVKAAHEKAGTDEHYCVYQVTAGLPTGTFLLIIPYGELGELDAVGPVRGPQYDEALGDQGWHRTSDLTASGTIEAETMLFAVDAAMSYPAAERIAGDTKFWPAR